MSVANRVIGRLHSANPSEGPRFYLYLLLLHKKGATSFEDLVTITKHNGDRQTFFEQTMDKNGILQDTTKPDYRRAAQELGFVSADDEYELLLQDASRFQRPGQLRQLFAHLLIHCEVADAAKLFATLADDDWGEDFARRLGLSSDSVEVKEKVLQDLQDILARAGQTLESFSMPLPQGLDIPMDTNREVDRETRYDRELERNKANTQRAQMYPKQGEAFDEIARCVDAEEPGAFFHRWPRRLWQDLSLRSALALCPWSRTHCIGVRLERHRRSSLGGWPHLPLEVWLAGTHAARGCHFLHHCSERACRCVATSTTDSLG